MKLIRKVYNGVVPNGKVLNKNSSSVTDTYSCDYINNKFGSITTGNGVINNDYVSKAEINHYEKIGNIVSCGFTLTCAGTWGHTTKFISGLPKPVSPIRFDGVNTNYNRNMRFHLNADGTISNAYSDTTPTAGDIIEGQITYITLD